MRRRLSHLALAFLAVWQLAQADDGRGLARSGNPADVTISGVSSGAAMAIQYAIAHSASIKGVGSIAGPGWGCAEGKLSVAVEACMCGRQPPSLKPDAARALAKTGAIDALPAGKPRALDRAYVFQSDADETVVAESGQASIDFLRAFIGRTPVVDRGNAADGSNRAGHGIVSPDGTDACQRTGHDGSFIRQCGADDNAGKLLLALHRPGTRYDASKRVPRIPESEIWQFNQQAIIDRAKQADGEVAADASWWLFPFATQRRRNFDMAATGYLYVPPACRASGSRCGIHIALHGCRQSAKTFASTAGYNNWADHYRLIIVYPALVPSEGIAGEICVSPVILPPDSSSVKPNPNGCWDWWGYLDNERPRATRYLTKAAPQIRVIEEMIREVTGQGQEPR